MSIRIELAQARIALRAAQDHFELTKAQGEHQIIGAAGGKIGNNAEERSRNLLLALEQDPDYVQARARLREAQAKVDRLQAEIEDMIDARRKDDRASRDRLSAALEVIALQVPRTPLKDVLTQALELYS